MPPRPPDQAVDAPGVRDDRAQRWTGTSGPAQRERTVLVLPPVAHVEQHLGGADAEGDRWNFEVRTRWRNEQPALKLRGWRDLPRPAGAAGTKLCPRGRAGWQPCTLGQGAEADYAGVRTSVARPSWSTATTRFRCPPRPRPQLQPVRGCCSSSTTAPAAWSRYLRQVSRRCHRDAEPRGRPPPDRPRPPRPGSRLQVYSNPTTEYLYDVVGKYPTRSRRISPTARVPVELAQVDMSFRNYRPAQATDFR